MLKIFKPKKKSKEFIYNPLKMENNKKYNKKIRQKIIKLKKK
jgi:hypothetical protein